MNLGSILIDHRHMRRESLRELAKRIGIEHSALFRCEKGKPLDQKNLVKLIKWLLS